MYVSRVLIYGCISLSKENIFTSMRDRTNRSYIKLTIFQSTKVHFIVAEVYWSAQ